MFRFDCVVVSSGDLSVVDGVVDCIDGGIGSAK